MLYKNVKFKIIIVDFEDILYKNDLKQTVLSLKYNIPKF
jgi:hypothetical protein